MTDFGPFFKPVEIEIPTSKSGIELLGDHIEVHTSKNPIELDDHKIAIFGICDDRNSDGNEGCANGPLEIRKHLYHLKAWDKTVKIFDLGDILPGNSIEDTWYAVKEVVSELVKSQIIPVILGGSQDLTYPIYTAYEGMEQTVNLVTVDSRLDFGGQPDDILSSNYLNKIVLHQPNYLFNYSNLGNQRYLVDNELIELMEKMYFDLHRLGNVQAMMEVAEPVMRNADIVSFDMQSIRMSDAPGSAGVNPNGFYGEEACRLCRYAGMSDKLSSFGIFEYNPSYDNRKMTAYLAAQMVWFFVEGVSQRKNDYPIGDRDDYLKYIVEMTESGHQIIFYKSPRTDRWWMDVPYPAGKKNKYERHHLVPCTYHEYQSATNEELPDRWWKTYQKLT